MAFYKRTSKNLTKNTRKTRTQSSSGSYTNSTSVKTSTGRTTYTQKSNGQSYTTVTTRMSDGSIQRKRISSYSPKKTQKGNSGGGAFGIILAIMLIVTYAILNSIN